MAKKSTSKQSFTKQQLIQIRSIVEDLYINNDYTLEQLSEKFDVSTTTLSAWKKGREGEKSWDERKVFVSTTPSILKEKLLAEAIKVAAGEKSAIKADDLSKIMSAIRQLDGDISVRIISEVLKLLDAFAVQVDPVLAIEMCRIHKLFLLHRITLEA